MNNSKMIAICDKSQLSEVYQISFGPLTDGKITIPIIATVDRSLPNKVGVAEAEAEFGKFVNSSRITYQKANNLFGESFTRKNYLRTFVLSRLKELNSGECCELRGCMEDIYDRFDVLTARQINEIKSYSSESVVCRLLNKYMFNNDN